MIEILFCSTCIAPTAPFRVKVFGPSPSGKSESANRISSPDVAKRVTASRNEPASGLVGLVLSSKLVTTITAGTSRLSKVSSTKVFFRHTLVPELLLNQFSGFQPVVFCTMINLFSAPVAGGADLEEPKTMPGSHSLTVLIAWNRRPGLDNLNLGNAITRWIRQ